jgi:dihydrofolate reductase
MRVSVYIAASLDGYIARENGSLDWLPGIGDGDSTEDYGYHEFMETVDLLMMGRDTFETVLSFGQWPFEKPVVVLSGKRLAIPDNLCDKVETMSGALAEIVSRLEQRGVRHVYLDGGRTIQGFLAAGLVNQLIITSVPLLLGGGRPLFGPLERDIRLRHLETRSFSSGLVQSRYEVIN